MLGLNSRSLFMQLREERSKSARTQLGLGHDRDFAAVVSVFRRDQAGPILGRDRTHILGHLAHSHTRSSSYIAFGIPTSNYINRNIVRYRPVPHRDYISKNSTTRCMLIGQKSAWSPSPFLSVVRPQSAADRADRRA